jgi:hypothetical protein
MKADDDTSKSDLTIGFYFFTDAIFRYTNQSQGEAQLEAACDSRTIIGSAGSSTHTRAYRDPDIECFLWTCAAVATSVDLRG